jgi:uncharacterized membrane protein
MKKFLWNIISWLVAGVMAVCLLVSELFDKDKEDELDPYV